MNEKLYNRRYEEVNIKLYYDKECDCFVAESPELPAVLGADENPIKTLMLFTEFYSQFLIDEQIDKIADVSKRK